MGFDTRCPWLDMPVIALEAVFEVVKVTFESDILGPSSAPQHVYDPGLIT